MGFGPAIAAILLSSLRGRRCATNSKRWWTWFSMSFMILLVNYLSILATGDGIAASDFRLSQPQGFSALNISLCIMSSTVGAFIIAATFGAETPIYKGYVSLAKAKKWLLIALLLPSVWLMLGFFIANMQHKEINDVLGGLDWSTWFLYVSRSVIFTLLVVAVGEELGWRGWLLPALQERFSPLISSILIGVFWGLWHFPLYVTGGYSEPPYMVFAKVGLCIFLSILFTFLHNRSHGNVLAAILLHAALNSSQRFIPVTEEMGMLMMLTIFIVPFLDRMWRKQVIN
jgi:membrane protease YdiL (CAAX protease family)